ncbi:MAG: NifB/NifX family molybdenum-iron cluster-binding protein [Melioribacteraceae bacterium]|nr:NifB/NifX family molybdenum-iron cluster-binding protein [Melioribacteraceae bacterium]
MKIAVASTGNSLDALVSEKFGRCQYFLIIDSDTMNHEAVLNPGEQMQNGAGPKAAELIINKGAKVLLSGHVGDKADTVLKKAGIIIVDGLTGKEKVKNALNNYLKNKEN